MIIDAHQHFWEISRGDYGWLNSDLGGLYKDYLPEDLWPILQRNGINGTILVQAAPTIEETEFMLRLAHEHPWILGVVGWVDMKSNNAVSQIEHFAKQNKFCGIRPMLQDIEESRWILDSACDPAFAALSRRNLTFDALIQPRHFDTVIKLAQKYPELRIVIDHAGKPNIENGMWDEWLQALQRLATMPNVFCKISGLITETGPNQSIQDTEKYIEMVIEIFGAKKTIWGSDWPVSSQRIAFDDLLHHNIRKLSGMSSISKNYVMGRAAIKAYGLDCIQG